MFYKMKLMKFGLMFITMVSLQVSANDVIVNERMNGNSVVVQPDAMLIIKLTANPSTGYAWHVAGIDRSIMEDVSGATCSNCGSEYIYTMYEREALL